MDSEVSDGQILEIQRSFANQIVTKLNEVSKPGCIATVLDNISGRIVGSGNSLAILCQCSPHDWAFDGASILRNIYDVMLQGLYIMADPSKQEARAQLYLDFIKVERKKRIDLIDASGTDTAKHVRASPKRPKAEPEIHKQFNAVEHKFRTKKGGLRDYWYSGSLRDLAKASGFEPEYELMQRFLSGVVHSSPLTLKEGPIVSGFLLMDWHWRFAFRILGAYADYKKVVLDKAESGLIDSARANVFDAR